MRLTDAMRVALWQIAAASTGQGRRGFRKEDAQATFRASTITALRKRNLIAARRLNVGCKATPVTFFAPTERGRDVIAAGY